MEYTTFTLDAREKEQQENAYIAPSTHMSASITLKSKYPARVYADSIFNTVTGQWTPVKYKEVEVFLDEVSKHETRYLAIPLLICFLICGFLVLFSFIKLIYNINKERIFEWKNVKLLRRIGVALCIIFLFQAVCGYLMASYSTTLVQIPGYTMNKDDIIEYIYLILGVISLLVGEFFAIGLRMKEEQELTI